MRGSNIAKFCFFVTLSILVGSLILCLALNVVDAKHSIENKFSDIYVSEAAKHQPLNTSIFVWVMTAPKNHDTRVQAVNSTWLHRFPHATVFTSQKLEDERIPFRVVFKDFDDSYGKLFHKTRFGFYYAYMNISKNFDWYIKADDDTYVLPENVEKYLATLDPNKPIYTGYTWKHLLKHGHNGGGFYAISRAAMKVFVEQLYQNQTACKFDKYEDVGIGRCLENAGIYALAAKDKYWHNLFKPGTRRNFKYYKGSYLKYLERFSHDMMAIHYMSPEQMLGADLFHYRT